MMNREKFYRQIRRAERQAFRLGAADPKASARVIRDYDRQVRRPYRKLRKGES